MANILVEVIEPKQVRVQGEYDHAVIPGIDGDFGVDLNHTPFITKLRPGMLQLFKDKEISRYAVHDGFVTVENNHIIIVCDTIEKDSEINYKRAEEAKIRAEKRLNSAEDGIDFRRAEFALKKALIRLQLSNN